MAIAVFARDVFLRSGNAAPDAQHTLGVGMGPVSAICGASRDFKQVMSPLGMAAPVSAQLRLLR